MTATPEHSAKPSAVLVAIELDKKLLVAALQATGTTVGAMNPQAVARYRDRHGSLKSLNESDPGDAAILVNIVEPTRERCRHAHI